MNNNDLWNASLWYNIKSRFFGRNVDIVKYSSTGRTAWVKDHMTGANFVMATVDIFPHTRKGSLFDWNPKDWEC